MTPQQFLPVDVVFHPDWWYQHYGLTFDKPFHFDPAVRVESERRMRQALYDRFSQPQAGVLLGEADARPRPVVGPVHLAIGFVVQGMLGCEIRFAPDASPQTVCAERLQPYGVHHCGDNMHRITGCAKIKGADFFDVSWGSDVAACREMLPDAFFSLRLSPVRLRRQTPQGVAADVENLLMQAGPLEQTAVCCVGIDSTVLDDNIRAIFETVDRYRRYGA